MDRALGGSVGESGWDCANCGRNNRPGARRCILCGGPRPDGAGETAETRAPAPRSSGLHGKARWEAGLAALREKYGEFPDPRVFGGQERLARAGDAEIDLQLLEMEADLLEALAEDEAA